MNRLHTSPGGSDGKESAPDAGGPDLTPGLGRSTEGGNVKPLQYSFLDNSIDRVPWQAIVDGVPTTE